MTSYSSYPSVNYVTLVEPMSGADKHHQLYRAMWYTLPTCNGCHPLTINSAALRFMK